MARLGEDILQFLESNGFRCSCEASPPDCSGQILHVYDPEKRIMPIEISATTPEEAAENARRMEAQFRELKKQTGTSPIIISEDWWNSERQIMQNRLLAHLGRHFQVYARNCEIRRIEKAEAAAFLNRTHSYGDATCRYRYGLFLKRHTGHIAKDGTAILEPGTLVAVATFSNGRKWIKGDRTIRSYEWTRYASLPGIRVNGGMGKLLKAFIKEVKPDDIMSYADLEWSEGSVYEQLGFQMEEAKAPVCFRIDTNTWKRSAQNPPLQESGYRYYQNFGSAKYRLKLTEYQNNG